VTTTKFMDHPDIEIYFDEIFPLIIQESDRGAVLLGVSYIDEKLNLLFKDLLPSGISNKRRKDIFSYTGPFGGISSKLDVALVCRLLPEDLIRAINLLRKIRNSIAHDVTHFCLEDHKQRLSEILELIGEKVYEAVNDIALSAMLDKLIKKFTSAPHPTETDKPLFESEESALTYIRGNEEIKGILREQRLRWEVGIGVGLICGLILFHKDKTLSWLGDSGVISGLISD